MHQLMPTYALDTDHLHSNLTVKNVFCDKTGWIDYTNIKLSKKTFNFKLTRNSNKICNGVNKTVMDQTCYA